MILRGKIYFRFDKRSQVFYQEIKQKWGREEYSNSSPEIKQGVSLNESRSLEAKRD
jgi:hypothetical protein